MNACHEEHYNKRKDELGKQLRWTALLRARNRQNIFRKLLHIPLHVVIVSRIAGKGQQMQAPIQRPSLVSSKCHGIVKQKISE